MRFLAELHHYSLHMLSAAHPERLLHAEMMQNIADELMSNLDLKWQHLTLTRAEAPIVEGAWSNIKRSVVEALGPSGFSLLARAREMMGKTSLEFTQEEISELMVALELGANAQQRQALEPLLSRHRPY